MEQLNNFLKKPVPRAAKIFAVLLLIFNLMAFFSYFSALSNPELLRQAAQAMGLSLSQEQYQALISSIPLQMVFSGITIAGLLLILFNRTWGFLLFAVSPILSSIFSLVSGDLLGMLTSLLPVFIMLLFLRTSSSPQPGAIPSSRSEPVSSNYSFNLPDKADPDNEAFPRPYRDAGETNAPATSGGRLEEEGTERQNRQDS